MDAYIPPRVVEEDSKKPPSRFKRFRRAVGDRLSQAGTGFGRLRVAFRNRRLRRVKHEYVVVTIGGPYPERDAPPRTFVQRQLPIPAPPMSIQGYNRMIQRLIDADNVHGVLLRVKGVGGGFATIQSLRGGIERLRASGKHVVAYLTEADNSRYLLASAADQIVMAPGADFSVTGLLREVLFLKDALAFIGVSIDNFQISPYKTAADVFDKTEMTPEFAEQMNRLLDESYDMLVETIASGRGLTQEAVKLLIDWAPLTPEEAKSADLIDHIAYDDELAEWLARFLPEPEAKPKRNWRFWRRASSENAKNQTPEKKPSRKAKLVLAKDVAKRLRLVYRRPIRGQKIAVVSIEGTLTRGPSQTPPVDLPIPFIGGATAGSDTLNHVLRTIERDDDIKALIVQVNSPGGDALGSELIARDIQRIAQKIPVVGYMGNVAASGGYFVSAPVHKIVAQPGTLTGSIGVVLIRPDTTELYQNLKTNRFILKRGENADLLTDVGTLTGDKRQKIVDGIDKVYGDFKRFVADGRNLPYESLDPICEGRVWTGREALQHQLVDELGDFRRAIEVAAELAEIPVDDSRSLEIENIYPESSRYMLPKPFKVQGPAEMIPFLLHRIQQMSGTLLLMPFQFKDR